MQSAEDAADPAAIAAAAAAAWSKRLAGGW